MQDNLQLIKKELKKIVSYPTVQGDFSENAPFGTPLKEGLAYFLSLAESFGFQTKNYSSYCGEVIFGDGEDKDGFAILCHLDVVPVGDEKAWKYPPFNAVEEDGKIYGRGTIDNKAPLVCSLFALKKLKDEGLVPKRKIKLIVGCNEETGWKCMEHYNTVAVMPDEGFSPDGDFPVIYAEKGISHVKFIFDRPKLLTEAYGGDAVNVVCDKANIVYDGKEYSFQGKTAHGSTPQNGINAIEKAFEFLKDKDEACNKIYSALFKDCYGIKNFSDETGRLTFSPDVMRIEGDKLYITVDTRYPCTLSFSELEKVYAKIGKYELVHHQAPLMVDKDSELVKTLLRVYNEATGRKDTPIAIGGGTYARCLKRGVAFGPTHYDEPSRCHMPNEFVKVEELESCFNIFYQAIKELCF